MRAGNKIPRARPPCGKAASGCGLPRNAAAATRPVDAPQASAAETRATRPGDSPAGLTAEVLILPDGQVLAHNLTPAFAAVLHELNPRDPQMSPRLGAATAARRRSQPDHAEHGLPRHPPARNPIPPP